MATDKKNAAETAAEEVKKAAETVSGEENAQQTATKTAKAAVKQGPTVVKRSERRKDAQPDAEEAIESALGRTEQFIEKNGKALLTALVVILIVVGGFLAYKYYYVPGRTESAGEMMYAAEQQFAVDSFSVALMGDGNTAGFLDVIKEYGSTAEGNVANHYAGICYLKMGDLDNALKYLGEYSTTKGAPNQIINAQNLGLQGDIMVQKGEYDKAAEKFRKAVDASENSFTTPVYLKKLALAYDRLGKHKEAEEALQRVADEFPGSMEVRDVEKYIGQQEQKQ